MTANQSFALLIAASGGAAVVVTTPMMVVPIVNCIGLPLAMISGLVFCVGWVALGERKVGWPRHLVGLLVELGRHTDSNIE